MFSNRCLAPHRGKARKGDSLSPSLHCGRLIIKKDVLNFKL